MKKILLIILVGMLLFSCTQHVYIHNATEDYHMEVVISTVKSGASVDFYKYTIKKEGFFASKQIVIHSNDDLGFEVGDILEFTVKE